MKLGLRVDVECREIREKEMEKTETERQGGCKGRKGEDKKGGSGGLTRATQEGKKERRKEEKKMPDVRS